MTLDNLDSVQLYFSINWRETREIFVCSLQISKHFQIFFLLFLDSHIKMPFRFAANLNFLFCENGVKVLDKFPLARAAGFRGIELGFPEQHTKDEVIAGIQENQLNVALLNIALGKINCYLKHPQPHEKLLPNLQIV